MKRICFYHAGCPDGFGAAWATWSAWGDEARYIARRHDQTIHVDDFTDAWVAYVDIAPDNEELRALARVAGQVTVLDHHVSARDRFLEDPALANQLELDGHEVVYEMEHSGAVLAWNYFGEGAPVPDLLRYIEDQDLWNWQLPDSAEVNAAIGAHPRSFQSWTDLSRLPVEELAREGESIVRASRIEVMRSLQHAHPVQIDGRPCEAVNATHNRSAVGHELAKRKTFGLEWGCVYRVVGPDVFATIYSIGTLDVSRIATGLGGGGHRNASGFRVPLSEWLENFLPDRVAASPQ